MARKRLENVLAAALWLVVAGLSTALAQADVRVNIDKMSGFGTSSKTKVEAAADLLEVTLNSDAFRQAVLGHKYGGKVAFAGNSRTLKSGAVISNMTNEQIYDAIMQGAEQLKTSAAIEDQVANYNLYLYTPPWYKKWSVVGYTYPGQPTIYMNWYYFNSFEIYEVAANMAHEWTHKLGFDHDYNRTARRPCSVPYAIGDLVSQIAGNETPTVQSCEKP